MVANLSSFRPEDARLCYIRLPLYLLRVWGTVRFFVAISYPGHLSDSHNLLLLYLQCVGDSSHALVNFILFCVFDKEIRITYGKACMRWVWPVKLTLGNRWRFSLLCLCGISQLNLCQTWCNRKTPKTHGLTLMIYQDGSSNAPTNTNKTPISLILISLLI